MAKESRSAEEQTQANAAGAPTEGGAELTVYEVGYHLVPSLSDTDAAALAASIRGTITGLGCTVLAEEAPKHMTLAYRIERSVAGKREKYTESWFGWFKFEAPKGAVEPIEMHMRDDGRIFRHLVVHAPREAIQQAPRAVFSSDRLEGRTIEKRAVADEKAAPVSEEELDKSLEALAN